MPKITVEMRVPPKRCAGCSLIVWVKESGGLQYVQKCSKGFHRKTWYQNQPSPERPERCIEREVREPKPFKTKNTWSKPTEPKGKLTIIAQGGGPQNNT